MPLKDEEKIGKTTRGDLYRETLFLRGLIRSAIGCADDGDPDNGLYEVLHVAERMADDLANRVSP